MSVETEEESLTVKLETEIQKIESVEDKLKFVLGKMKEAVADEKSLNFKLFWEARHLSLQLFKENLHPVVRAKFWNDFVELSKEAKCLKAILDEQASFTIEQIELAIIGLEKDIGLYSTLLGQMEAVQLPVKSVILEKRKKYYADLQKELNLLNVFTSRIHSLRKEVLKTEMRVKFKSKFFKLLSTVGDNIFPKRKEFIREISTNFISDVEYFSVNYFPEDGNFKVPFYVLKEEIKKLQNVSKIFTLNTKAFTQVRMKLSECWDKLKKIEIQYKKEMEEKKDIFEQNKKTVQEKIQGFAHKCRSSEEPAEHVVTRETDEILKFMRTIELSSRDVKFLKDALYQAKRPLLEKEEIKAAKAREVKEEKNKARILAIGELKEQIQKAVEQGAEKNSTELSEQSKSFTAEMRNLHLTKAEKQPLEKQLKLLKELINDKKDQALLSLSSAELESLSHLKGALENSEARRKEIKDQLEVLRQMASGSDLDFEKAISYREQIEKEKERLQKVNSVINEIEEKMFKLKGN